MAPLDYTLSLSSFSFPLTSVPEAAPVGITAFSPSSTSIQVSWELVPPACRNGIIQGYSVNYGITPTNGRAAPTAILTPSTNIVLTSLEIFVNYSICIQARTSVGTFGPCSSPMVVRTLNDSRCHYKPLPFFFAPSSLTPSHSPHPPHPPPSALMFTLFLLSFWCSCKCGHV